MRPLAHFPLIIIALALAILGDSCSTAPTAAFDADKTTIYEGESVQFTDMSTKDPTTWLWNFPGGDPTSSIFQDPSVTYYQEGVYSVTLEVRRRNADNVITKTDYITVLPGNTDLTFKNNTYSEIRISIGGVEKTMGSGGEVTFFDLEEDQITYIAETSGTTSTGSQLGIKLFWNWTVILNGGAQNHSLDIGPEYFFLRLQNTGYYEHDWGPIDIDDGSPEVWSEEIVIPTNGVIYGIGYYNAWESTVVVAYWNDQPDTWLHWDHGVHFTFPDSINQNILLVDKVSKKSARLSSGGNTPAYIPLELPRIDAGFNPLATIPEGTTRHFPNKAIRPQD